jgi:hypothetical protein
LQSSSARAAQKERVQTLSEGQQSCPGSNIAAGSTATAVAAVTSIADADVPAGTGCPASTTVHGTEAAASGAGAAAAAQALQGCSLKQHVQSLSQGQQSCPPSSTAIGTTAFSVAAVPSIAHAEMPAGAAGVQVPAEAFTIQYNTTYRTETCLGTSQRAVFRS